MTAPLLGAGGRDRCLRRVGGVAARGRRGGRCRRSRRVIAPLDRARRAVPRRGGASPARAGGRRRTLFAAGWLLGGPLPGLVVAREWPRGDRGLVLAVRRRRWRRELGAAWPASRVRWPMRSRAATTVRRAIVQVGAPGAIPGRDRDGHGAAAEQRVARKLEWASRPKWCSSASVLVPASRVGTVVAAMLLQRDAGGDLPACCARWPLRSRPPAGGGRRSRPDGPGASHRPAGRGLPWAGLARGSWGARLSRRAPRPIRGPACCCWPGSLSARWLSS